MTTTVRSTVSRSDPLQNQWRLPAGIVLGAVMGLLVAGFALPFLFKDPASVDLSAGAGGLSGPGATVPGTPQGSAGGTTPDASGPVGGASSGPGSATSDADAPAGAATANDSGPVPGSSDPGSLTGSAPDGGPAEPAPVDNGGATDVGVTGDTVTLAILVADAGGAGQLGFTFDIEPEDTANYMRAHLAHVNDAGGINGRKIDVKMITFDPVQQDRDKLAACRAATEDLKAFAVLTTLAFNGPAVQCVTKEHDTPLVTYENLNGSDYAQAPRRTFGIQWSANRAEANKAAYAHSTGMLDGKTVGVVYVENLGEAPRQGLIPTLEAKGVKIAHTTVLGSNPGQVASQIPLEVNRMQAAGVDTIFLSINLIYGTQWVNQASSSGYTPLYITGDFQQGALNAYGDNMPDSFAGARSITAATTDQHLVGAPTPGDQRCLDRFETATGETVEPGSLKDDAVTWTCGLADAVIAGITGSGPRLTRDGFGQGVEAMGSFPFGRIGGGLFGPGRHDAANLVRSMTWDGDFWVPDKATFDQAEF